MKVYRLIAAVCVLLLLSANAHAGIIYVNARSASGDGSTWAAALPTLTSALERAKSGDHIWVAAGTYTPGEGRDATFALKQGVEVYGGFAGNEADLKKRDIEKHLTILSGDIGQPGIPDDNVYHVVTGANSAVLDGFTISGGYSANAGWDGAKQRTPADITAAPRKGLGAGMINFQAAPEVRNCSFQDNHALMGGAVYNMTAASATPTAQPTASPKFTDCVFWQNSALVHGGGVVNEMRTAPLFVSCVFDSNLADVQGGGMYNDFGTAPKLLNTIFRNNEAQFGGGMANQGSSIPVFYYCTFTGNRSLETGPAIYQGKGLASTTVLTKTIIWDNQCECEDKRFFNEGASAIRAQDCVIQNGYEGRSIFRANPGLDRKSETMLNVGYKTNGYRFRPSKLEYRIKDIAKYEISTDLPAYDTAYSAQVDPALANAVAVAPTPAPAPIPAAPVLPQAVMEPKPVIPEPAPAPAAPEPLATPAPKPEPMAAPTPEPVAPAPPAPKAEAPAPPPVVPVAPVEEPAPEPKPVVQPEPKPEPQAVAMVEPQQPMPAQPAPRPDGPPSAAQMMQDMDLDGNQCITINEATGPMQRKFWRYDLNGNGCLSMKELERLEAKRSGKGTKPQAVAQAQPAPRKARPVPAAPQVKTATQPNTVAASTPAPAPMAAPAPQAVAKPAPKPAVTASVAPPKPVVRPAPAKPAPVAAPARVKKPTGPSTGYTLFAPIGGKETYLIDMKGKTVKTWKGTDRSSGSVYLLNNGNLLRTISPSPKEVKTPFIGQGVNSGIIQEVSPRGQVVWEYSYVSDEVRQHHDIEPLPNGNVLILAWELKTAADITAAGGSVRNHPEGKLWVEHIVEVRKAGPRQGYIVWEWHAWDHLVQNTNKNAPNYANPVRIPQRIDVNYNPRRIADWQHANSIDFNPVSNLIVLSMRNLNEIWVIDHSTTTEQAASNSGGVMKRGGDLLFRWGNPATYGSSEKQMLFGQHDARWITGARPGDETILIFNNGTRRIGKSDVLEIKPEYFFKSTRLNARVNWSYVQQGGKPFFADHVSGAQRLENGNTLVTDGTGAHLFEVTPAGKIVWNYQYDGPKQGAGSHIFRATRIPESHPGLRRLSLK